LHPPLSSLRERLQEALRAAAGREAPVPVAEHTAELEALGRDTGLLARLVEGLRNLPGLPPHRLGDRSGQERGDGSLPAEDTSRADVQDVLMAEHRREGNG
ncbi:hypothetical protein ACLESO_45905, partial [Pyxidicoccus sp. 3LG]